MGSFVDCCYVLSSKYESRVFPFTIYICQIINDFEGLSPKHLNHEEPNHDEETASNERSLH